MHFNNLIEPDLALTYHSAKSEWERGLNTLTTVVTPKVCTTSLLQAYKQTAASAV